MTRIEACAKVLLRKCGQLRLAAPVGPAKYADVRFPRGARQIAPRAGRSLHQGRHPAGLSSSGRQLASHRLLVAPAIKHSRPPGSTIHVRLMAVDAQHSSPVEEIPLAITIATPTGVRENATMRNDIREVSDRDCGVLLTVGPGKMIACAPDAQSPSATSQTVLPESETDE
jgi:hypothetical protein